MVSHGVEGVVESYNFQMSVFDVAVARMPAAEDSEEPPPATLGRFYAQCVARNPGTNTGSGLQRDRFKFLRGLISRIVPEHIGGLHEAYPLHHGSSSGATPGGKKSFWAAAAAASGSKGGHPSGGDMFALGGFGGGDDGDSDRDEPAVDLALINYLAQTLMYLPYEREEDLLVICSTINRAVSLHGEGLASRLRRYLPATSGVAPGGVASPASAPLPTPGSPAYHRLAMHAGYAWALAVLLNAKAHLKRVYNVPDARVLAYDPASTVSARGPDKAVSVEPQHRTTEGRLPPVPADLVAALEPAATSSMASPGAFSPGSAGSAQLAAAAAAASAGLSPSLLQQVLAELEDALDEHTGDMSGTIPSMGGRRRGPKSSKKSKGAAEGEGDDAAAAAATADGGEGHATAAAGGAGAGAGKGKKAKGGKKGGRAGKKRKRKAASDDEDDDDEDFAGSDDEEGQQQEAADTSPSKGKAAGGAGKRGRAAAPRQSGRKRKAISYADADADADADGEDGEGEGMEE